MAREGMRLLSTHRSKNNALNKGRSNTRKRDTELKEDDELDIGNVPLLHTEQSMMVMKVEKAYDGRWGSHIQSSYNPDTESLFILREAKNMEFSRPRTSTGPLRFREHDNLEEETSVRPSTSHGKKLFETHDLPPLPTKSKTRSQRADIAVTQSPRYTWKRNPTTQESKSRSLATMRAVSTPMTTEPTQSNAEPVGVAIGSPPDSPQFARTMSTRSTAPMYSRGSLSSVLPQHVITLESNKPNRVDDDVAPSQEPIQRGWKKLFGRGLFNKKQVHRSPCTSDSYNNELTFSNAPSPTNVHESNCTTTPLIVEPSNISEMEILDLDISQETMNSKQTNNAPHLDVNIPDVQMERYSVMFDSLLKTNSKTPLYARRKSKDVSMVLGQKISENPAATPQLSIKPNNRDSMTFGLINRSPLWLFPATPKTPSTPQTPSRSRAMTLPVKSAIDHLYPSDSGIDSKTRPTSDLVPSLLLMLQGNHSDHRTDGPLSGKLQGPLSPFSVMSQDSELDTPIDGNNEEAPWVRKFDFQDEQDWSALSTPLRPRTPSPTEMYSSTSSSKQAEELIATAARISIARQISISQRQLLLPIVHNPERFMKSPTSSNVNSPVTVSMTNISVEEDNNSMAPTSAVASTPPRRISDIPESSYIRIDLEV